LQRRGAGRWHEPPHAFEDFKLAQESLEGELYITGSRIVAILGKIRAYFVSLRIEWADSEKGTRVLVSVIEGFETRFGDDASVCEVDCEGPSRQPRGYTKVRAILFSLVLFCPLLYLCTKSTHSDTALALTPLSLSLSLSVCETPHRSRLRLLVSMIGMFLLSLASPQGRKKQLGVMARTCWLT